MTLLEATVALVVVGIVVAAVIPVLSRTTGIRDQVEHREVALQALANLLERAAVLPERTEASLRSAGAAVLTADQLPQSRWEFSVQAEEPALQRIEARLTWQPRDQTPRSVSLVRWYPGGQP
jgi:type II secretory pathway pseudopilin PulG